MKKILTAAIALSVLASAGVASAQPYRHDDHRDNRQAERQDDRRADRQYDRQMDRAERKYDKQVRKAERRYRAAAYQRPAGYRHHQWRAGERLPANYRGSRYRVDHRQYGLRAPPPGYYYTRVDNDVVLTAAATGAIASIIVGMFQ